VKFSFLTILSIFHKYGALSLRQGINDNFLAFLGCKGIRTICINLTKW
jgi:hypothetical protein